jgi:molecular chaperone DnaK
LTPQEVSAKILHKLKTDAEAYLGHEVTQAVITVPAYFHDSQRQATRDAGRLAGLDVKRVINEPTAACLAYGYTKLAEQRQKVAVYDLGGGTFDISILEVGRGPFRVRATNGDTYLGGDDLDWLLIDWIMSHLDTSVAARLKNDILALVSVRFAVEQAKIDLSTTDEADMCLEEMPHLPPELRKLGLRLSRMRLDEIAEAFIRRTLAPCERALQDARLQATDLQDVLLVGGQTRMPAIRQAVHNFFQREPVTNVNPVEIVALGAAVQAAILANEATGLKLADVVPLTLGVSTKGRMDELIKRNTTVPVVKTRVYTTAEENQESVEIQIYQGEYPTVADNIPLGKIELKGIEPAPAGEPEIEVTFRVDQDCILHVTGKDLRSGNFKELTITDSVRLSEEEIEAMIREAEAHAEEYAEQQQEAEAKEQAELLMQQFTELLREKEQRLPDALVAEIKIALQAPTPEDWQVHLDDLRKLWQQAHS